jgi:multiple sugar transport system substrate-binding protein
MGARLDRTDRRGLPPINRKEGAMRLRRVFVGLAAVVLIAAACSSDGGGGSGSSETGSEPVMLDFWVFGEGGIGDFLGSLENDYEAKNPNIDLNITSYPEENFGVKLDTAIAAGQTPDLIVFPDAQQAREGLILPLDDMVQEKNIDLSGYVPAVVNGGLEDGLGCGFEGQLYCLGSYAGSTQMIYNKDMFDAAGIPYPAPWPPMTPEEFVDTACQLTDEANGVWGGAASDPLAYVPFDMMFSADGKTATGYVNGPDFVHQMDLLASGYERGCFPSANVLDPWAEGRDYLSDGKLAMVITDFQGLKQIENAGINWGSTAPPTPAGVEPYFFVWSDNVAIMADTEHPEEAKDFVAYVTTEGQRIRYETEGSTPLDLNIADEVNWAGGIPGREDGLEVLSHARPMVFVPNRWDVAAPYYDAWGFVLEGDKTAQEALDDAAPAIQENLDKAWDDWNSQG